MVETNIKTHDQKEKPMFPEEHPVSIHLPRFEESNQNLLSGSCKALKGGQWGCRRDYSAFL